MFPPCSAGSSEELDIRAVGCPTHFRFTTACFTDMGTKSREGTALHASSRFPGFCGAALKARRPATFPLCGPLPPPAAAAWIRQARPPSFGLASVRDSGAEAPPPLRVL